MLKYIIRDMGGKNMGYTTISRATDFSFNACPNLSEKRKQLLIKKYKKINQELNLLTAYGGATDEKRKMVEDFIISEFSAHPELMYMSQLDNEGNTNNNLARRVVRESCFETVKFMLNDKKAPLLTDNLGYNLGMYCAFEGTEEMALLALDNLEASIQQTRTDGNNIGMICANRGLVSATIKALNNEIASLQQNKNGDTIGMICARSMVSKPSMTACFEYAATNSTTLLIENNNAQTMFTIAQESGYPSAKLRDKFGDFYNRAVQDRTPFHEEIKIDDNEGEKYGINR